MGKYYCDYCDCFLAHDSQAARKAHNTGRNHVNNVIDYFSSLGHNEAQDMINKITRQYEGSGQRPPMGMGGGPSLMRNAGPPGPGGFNGQGGFQGPPGGMGMGMQRPPMYQIPGQGPPQQTPYGGGPPQFQQGPPQPLAPLRPGAPPTFAPQGQGQGQGLSPMNGNGFTPAPPGVSAGGAPPAAAGPGRPAVNPERLRMMGMA